MKNHAKPFIFIGLYFLSLVSIVSAQKRNIVPDSSFGKNGVAFNPPVPNNSVSGENFDIQPDGKIIVAGAMGGAGRWSILMRFNKTGSFDSSFGTSGIVSLSSNGSTSNTSAGVSALPNGKIIANGTGNSSSFIVRLNNNGTIDTTFGKSGYCVFYNKYTVDNVTLYVLKDGSIITGYMESINGTSKFSTTLIKSDSNGHLDPTFGTGGLLTVPEITSHLKLLVDHNNRIVVCGRVANSMCVQRFLADGTPDNTFGTNGSSKPIARDTLVLNFPNFYDYPRAAILSDNSIVVMSKNADPYLAKVATVHIFNNGTQDMAYGKEFGMGLTPLVACSPTYATALDNDEILYLTSFYITGDQHPVLGIMGTFGKPDSSLMNNKNSINILYDTNSKLIVPKVVKLIPGKKILVLSNVSLSSVGLIQYTYTGFSSLREMYEETTHQLQLFPNPAGTFVTIINKVNGLKETKLKVTDITGKTILDKRLPAGQDSINIETSDWCSGVYFVQLQSGQQFYSSKLVIQH